MANENITRKYNSMTRCFMITLSFCLILYPVLSDNKSIDIFNQYDLNPADEDPWMLQLIYSTYFGGSSSEHEVDVIIDSQDATIFMGVTESENIPILNAYDSTRDGTDAFLAKFSTNDILLWSTYLGGTGEELRCSVHVDSEDAIIVTGKTRSSDFPVLDAYDSTFNGSSDTFLSKFSSNGDLLWSTYLGGISSEEGYAVVVDSQDNIIVTGLTESTDFPTLNAFDSTKNGTDSFVSKFNSSGSLLWSTYLGGNSTEKGWNIAVDSQDAIIVTGETSSLDFPTLNAFDSTRNGTDAFVSKFNSSGSLIWSTYLGGSSTDKSWNIAVDSQDAIVVTGLTGSTNFPTLNAFDSTNDGTDAFLSKFNKSGSLIWSSYLGGSSSDWADGVAISSADCIIVVGRTFSSDFPTLHAYDTTYNSLDAFLVNFSASGSLCWSTYLGGTSHDMGYAVAIDSQDIIIISGLTGSTDFPTLNPYDSTYNGGFSDAYLAKFSPDLIPYTPTPTPTPSPSPSPSTIPSEEIGIILLIGVSISLLSISVLVIIRRYKKE